MNRCFDCGLIFVFPQPSKEELVSLYKREEGYFLSAETNLKMGSSLAGGQINEILKEVGCRIGRLLDVGCSTGQIMYYFKSLGWDVSGFDMNKGAVEIARANGLDARVSSIDSFDYPANSFDVVVMHHVLEHMTSPGEVLRKIRPLLRPDGRLILCIPNAGNSFSMNSLKLCSLGLDWFHSEAPYHLYEFTPVTIEKILLNNGFCVERLSCYGRERLFYLIGSSGYFDDLKRAMKGKKGYRINMKIFSHLHKAFPIAAILFPFWLISLILRHFKNDGNSMIIVATLNH